MMQGIKFNQDGVTAILEGRKTQTRRPLTDEQKFQCFYHCPVDDFSKYKIGETVFVQEEFVSKFAWREDTDTYMPDGIVLEHSTDINDNVYFQQIRDERDYEGISDLEWKPASEMTEKEARIFLKITNIKVERLQDISEEDCIKEGVVEVPFRPDDGWPMCIGYMGYKDDGVTSLPNKAIDAFKRDIWNKLPYQPPYDWDSNPYTFVYEFEVVK